MGVSDAVLIDIGEVVGVVLSPLFAWIVGVHNRVVNNNRNTKLNMLI